MAMKIGDVVRLKSGGPDMTIAKQVANTAYWYCQWFGDEGLKSGAFAAATLEIVDEEDDDSPVLTAD